MLNNLSPQQVIQIPLAAGSESICNHLKVDPLLILVFKDLLPELKIQLYIRKPTDILRNTTGQGWRQYCLS
ncbi:MAG: hypothetical protein P1P82_13060 [Bacteroidales bacterium]|nr:hypothetical protein [Bacteroidales bacterium]